MILWPPPYMCTYHMWTRECKILHIHRALCALCRSNNCFCTHPAAVWPNTCLFQHSDSSLIPMLRWWIPAHMSPGEAGQLWLRKILKCLEGPIHLFKAIVFSSASPMNRIKINTGEFLAVSSKSSTHPGQSLLSDSAMAFQLGTAGIPTIPWLVAERLPYPWLLYHQTYSIENIHTEDTPKSPILCSLTQRYNFIQLFWYSANTYKQRIHFWLKYHLITTSNIAKFEEILIPLRAECLYTDLQWLMLTRVAIFNKSAQEFTLYYPSYFLVGIITKKKQYILFLGFPRRQFTEKRLMVPVKHLLRDDDRKICSLLSHRAEKFFPAAASHCFSTKPQRAVAKQMAAGPCTAGSDSTMTPGVKMLTSWIDSCAMAARGQLISFDVTHHTTLCCLPPNPNYLMAASIRAPATRSNSTVLKAGDLFHPWMHSKAECRGALGIWSSECQPSRVAAGLEMDDL